MAARAVFDIRDASGSGTLLFVESGSGRLLRAEPFQASPDGRVLAPGAFGLALPEDCILSLPLGMLDFRVLTLPMEDRARIREVLPFEMDGLVLGPPDALAMDAVVLGPAPADGGTRVLVAYTDRARLASMLAGFHAAGADPQVVTCIELARVLASAPADIAEALSRASDVLTDEERAAAAEAEDRSPVINLRRGSLAGTREADRLRRTLSITAGLFALCCLLLSGAFWMETSIARTEAARAEDAVVSAYMTAFPGAERPASASGLGFKLKARMAELREQDAFYQSAPVLDVLMSLRQTRPDGLTYSEVQVDPAQAQLRGEARSMSDVEEARAALAEAFDSVRIDETGQKASGLMGFTITVGARRPR